MLHCCKLACASRAGPRPLDRGGSPPIPIDLGKRRAPLQVKRVGDIFLVRLETGEEVIESLKRFADAYRIGFGSIQAIGTFERVTLGYYDTETKAYQDQSVEEPVEVLNLSGNIAKGEDGEPIVHAHVTVGRSDYSTLGGHVVEATVGPTLEVIIETRAATVRRRRDPDVGLDLWDLNQVDMQSA